jgi:putative glutamine amidotransferase
VDDEQDGFDLEVARQTLAAGLPLLAVCRGLQVLNIVLGGALEQDMGGTDLEHRHVVHPVAVLPGSLLERTTGAQKVSASCYHHQRVSQVGEGLLVTAEAADGTIEALEGPALASWLVAVQWHPEDNAREVNTQQAIFDAFVRAACS